MSYQQLSSPEIKSFLIRTVKELGGPDMPSSSWHFVSRLLRQQFDIYIRLPNQLKTRYEVITKPQIEFQQDEMKVLFEAFFESQYDTKLAGKIFRQKIQVLHKDQEQFAFRLQARLKTSLSKCFEILLLAFCQKKQHDIYYAKKIKLPIILVFLRTQLRADEQLNEKEKQIKDLSLLFTEVLKLISQHCMEDRATIFEILSPIISRRKTKLILETIYYLEELKQIYVHNYDRDEQLIHHPFLKKTIQENFNDGIIDKFISIDWKSKMEMYHMCLKDQILDEQVVLSIGKDKKSYKIQTHKNRNINNEAYPKIKKQDKQVKQLIQTKKSIRLPEDYRIRSALTKKFDYEDDNVFDQVMEEDKIGDEDLYHYERYMNSKQKNNLNLIK